MKTNSILRGYTGLQAFFPTVSREVQEIDTVNPITVAASDDAAAYKPRLLAQRSARAARRLSH